MKRNFKKTFCLYVASFTTMSFIALAISFLFSPQYILLNRISLIKSSYNNVYKSLAMSRNTDLERDVWSLYSSVDECDLLYLFGDAILSVDSYISGKHKFDKFTVQQKNITYNRISNVMQNNLRASKSELMKNIELVANFANEWILDKNFYYYPSGDAFGIFVVAFCAFIPFPVYNFVFYNRYSGYPTNAAKRWNKRQEKKWSGFNSEEKNDE